MIKELIRLANHLDSKGLRKEADYLDSIVVKASSQAEGLGLEELGQGQFGDIRDTHRLPQLHDEISGLSSSDEIGVSKKVEHAPGLRDPRGMPDDGIEGSILMMLEDGELTAEDLERMAEIMRRNEEL
tara:strand:+ start:1334 stop:1717 length:384 start_codon:yes stop_codon:yes gene_type:complete